MSTIKEIITKKNKIEFNKNIKLIKFNELFHIGSLDKKQKNNFNLESNMGLSISTDPEAWQRINRGQTFGDLWTLEKKENKFLNYFELSKEQNQSIYKWAIEHKFIEKSIKYKYSYYDDELEEEQTFSYKTYEEAKVEAGDEYDIIEHEGYNTTSLFSKRVGKSNSDNLSLIICIYCEDETDFDGVYWDSETDILRYRAPRGVIFESKLNSWTKKNNSIENQNDKTVISKKQNKPKQ